MNIERNLISLKRQYDANYGPTVNSYVEQVVRKYDSDVRPAIDPYVGKVVNISTPLVISVKENSVLAYRVAEKYYSNYAKQAGVFLEKNVFTGEFFLFSTYIFIILNAYWLLEQFVRFQMNYILNLFFLNTVIGPLEINNLKLVASDTFEKFVNAYTDVWRWAANKVATLTQ